jgi:hypothetical protein
MVCTCMWKTGPQSVSSKPVVCKLQFDQLPRAGTSGLPFRWLNLQSFQSCARRTHARTHVSILGSPAAGERRYPLECHILAALLSPGQRPVNIEPDRAVAYLLD